MQYLFDKIGYPYVVIPSLNFGIALLPLTKYQLEEWLSDAGSPGDSFYAELLAVTPRLPRTAIATSASPLDAFASGLQPEEVTRFAGWLGPAFRIPTAYEWKTVSAMFQCPLYGEKLPSNTAPDALALWQRSPDEHELWANRMLMEGGFAEWVRLDRGYGLLGRPKNTCWPTYAPNDRPLTRLSESGRDALVGARLVQSLRGA